LVPGPRTTEPVRIFIEYLSSSRWPPTQYVQPQPPKIFRLRKRTSASSSGDMSYPREGKSSVFPHSPFSGGSPHDRLDTFPLKVPRAISIHLFSMDQKLHWPPHARNPLARLFYLFLDVPKKYERLPYTSGPSSVGSLPFTSEVAPYRSPKSPPG